MLKGLSGFTNFIIKRAHLLYDKTWWEFLKNWVYFQMHMQSSKHEGSQVTEM